MEPSHQEGDPTNTSSDQDPCPVQLIQFVRNEGGTTTIELQQDVLDAICAKIGDRPVSIQDVCGPARKGKSFFLGYVIRRLEGLRSGHSDWMGWSDPGRPLKGFTFRNGRAPETQGIWIWSSPFIIKTEDDQEVAVLLVDTQGTNDEFTSSKDMAAIVGLSLLMSSVTIFNFFNNLQEDLLLALNTYIQYGNLALDEEHSVGPPFQKLIFLIRDFQFPGEFPYGAERGQNFLDDTLSVKETHSPEAKHVRENLRQCFRETGCFLMPSIGEQAKSQTFTGSISELGPEFAKKMEEFINDLVNPDNIIVKEILENPVHASDLQSLLKIYVDVFNSDEVPSAGSMWQATAQLSNQYVLEKSLNRYDDFMAAELEDEPYLSRGTLDETHSEGELEALNWFRKSRKVGSPQLIEEFEEKLALQILDAFSQIKEANGRRQEAYITGATLEASNDFRSKLEQAFPFPEDTVFYDEVEINNAAENEKTPIMKTFKDKLVREEVDKLAKYIQSVVASFGTILSHHLSYNRMNLLNAERLMTTVIEELSNSHKLQLGEYRSNNKYEEDEAKLQDAHDQVQSVIKHEYRQKNLPGDEQFQEGFATKLDALMDDNFHQLKNEHMLHIELVKAEALECVSNSVAKYRELLAVGVQSEATMEGLLQCHENSKITATRELKDSLHGMDSKIILQSEADFFQMIEESFDEGKKLFEANARAAEQAQKAAEALAAASQAELEKAKVQAAAAEAARVHAVNMAEMNRMLQEAQRKKKDWFQRTFGW